MEDSNFVKIYTGNFIIAQLIVDKLEAVGIVPIVKDENESQRLTGFPMPSNGIQDIYVNNEELDISVPIVESVTAELQA